MRGIVFVIFFLSVLHSIGQDYLTVPNSRPSQFKSLSINSDKTELIDSFIYLFNPIDIPFKDDFTRNKLKKLSAKATDPGVFDTTFYRLFIGNQKVDTTDRYTNLPTKLYRFNPDSTAIDTTDLPSVQLTLNNYTVYPNTTQILTVYPAFNVYDTLGKPIDTIPTSFVYKQDSVIKYIVPADGNSLWQNDYVLINDDYAWNPPSYGVATFDGLDREGRAYDNQSLNTYGVTDYLTSVPFNIGYLQESDSVFLSFYYQPQGLGRDAPESEDSLVLEFFNPFESKWKLAWGTRGFRKSPFQLQLVKLADEFLQNGFQFRFKSKGNRSGAYDTWNLDYVYLNKNRNSNDTLVSDIAIGRSFTSMLKEYTSIPFWQYAAFSSAVMKDTISQYMLNNNESSRTVFFRYFISNPQGNYYPSFPFPASTNTSTSIVGKGNQNRELPLFDSPVNFKYPISDMDTANTFITSFIAQSSNIGTDDDFPENDTLYHEQRFDHYLAYDNGSAEAGYGVNIVDTTFGKRAMVAQEFRTFIDDTLNAVGIYFLPQGLDMEGQKFTICVWTDLSPNGLIYRSPAQEQIYYGDKNGYLTYLLDSSIIVSGTFYVGFEQNGFRSLNVGYDFKNDKKDKLFYSLNSGVSFFSTSAAIQPGTAMIRPYFRVNNNQVSVQNKTIDSFGINVFPNPTKGILTIELDSPITAKGLIMQVYSIQGRKVVEQITHSENTQLDLGSFENGIYLLRVVDKNGSVQTKRIIVSH